MHRWGDGRVSSIGGLSHFRSESRPDRIPSPFRENKQRDGGGHGEKHGQQHPQGGDGCAQRSEHAVQSGTEGDEEQNGEDEEENEDEEID